MSNRHLSRTITLQTLFEWDFNDQERTEEIESILEYNMREFSTGMCDLDFSKKIIDTVLEKKDVIDDIIKKAAPQWPIQKISVVDRNILRIGISELVFADRKEVPPKVAINEAIELAKSFGGDSSGRFVSGVLGTIYKEMGEPGKNDKAKNKKRIEDVPFDQLVIEKKCGAMVYAKNKAGETEVALVHDIFGHWTLPKGSIEKGESEEDCVTREIKEEIGVDVQVEDNLGDNEYVAYDPEKGKVRRQVVYYLANSEYKPLVLQEGEEAGGLDQARWFKLSEIMDLNFYDDILPIVTKAIEKLKK